MLRATLAAAAALSVLLAGGCQTFIGIDDVQGHLPRLDGDYLVGLKRLRADGTTTDTIRLVGTGRLDPSTRELRLSLSMLNVAGDTVSENAITGLVFPDDASTVDFDLSIAVPPEAVMNPSTNAADANVMARMTLRAEGDYAFCALPVAGGAMVPSIGSILTTPGATVPEVDMFDTGCDDL
jgi:hypothetical protein